MPRPRIASLLAASTEIVHALGLGESIVAISHECDHPPEIRTRPRVTRSLIDDRASSSAIDEQVRRMFMAGESLYSIDRELLASLRPDVVVTQAQCDVCAVRYDDVVAAVREAPALREAKIVAMNPRRLDDLDSDIRRIAAAVDDIDAGERLISALRERTAAISAPAARPRVICIEWTEPLMIAANWMPDLIDRAGGECTLTRTGEHSTYADWDEVCRYRPEVIVVAPCGFDLLRSIAEANRLRGHPMWPRLISGADGRVFAADGNALFNRAGPRLIDTIELLSGLVQPERFGKYLRRYAGSWRTIES